MKLVTLLYSFLVLATATMVENAHGYATSQGVLTQPNAKTDDRAGLGHIAMSSDGTTLAFATDIDVVDGDGGVYVYVRDANAFEYQSGPLRSAEVSSTTLIGKSVALNSDGTILAVSAWFDNSQRGAVIVFESSGVTWSQLGNKLLEETPAITAKFSSGKISISGDGSYIAAGSVQSGGKVTLFSRTGEGGTYEVNRTLSLSTTISFLASGLETLLSADGSTLLVYALVGATEEDAENAFWVFSHNLETDEWTPVATQVVVSSYKTGLASSSISSDGKTLAFALRGTVNFQGGQVAAVYVLDEGSYVLQQTIVDPDFTFISSASFNGIALSDNGFHLVVGMPDYEGGIGGTMAFRRSGSGEWIKTEARILGLTQGGIQSGASQGSTLAISENSDWLAVSAPFYGTYAHPMYARNTGGIFVFNEAFTSGPTQFKSTPSPFGSASEGTDSFYEIQKATLANSKPNEMFGEAVAISADGKTSVATASQRFVDDDVVGGLYIYTRSETATEWELSVGPVFAQSSITTPFGGRSTGLAISGDGTIIAAVAPAENSGEGAIGVIRFDGTHWLPFGPVITREIPFATDRLTVAISADGSTLATGEETEDVVGGIEIYAHTFAGYTRVGPALVGSGGIGDFSQGGNGIALSADGSTVAFSASADNNFMGALWVFKRDPISAEYSQVGNKLVHQDAYGLGQRLAISADGSILVTTGSADGSAFILDFPIAFVVFTYNNDTDTYSRIQSLVPHTNSYFAYPFAIALTGSGDAMLLGGATYLPTMRPEGRITRFTRSSDGTYKVAGSEFTGADQITSLPIVVGFGETVSVSADGKRLVSSAVGDNISRGAVYFFDLLANSPSPTTASPTFSMASPTFNQQSMLVAIVCSFLAVLQLM